MKLAAVGDFLAIPGFIALVAYFLMLAEKSVFEILLLCFSVSGLVADIFFCILECQSMFEDAKPLCL
jgi:hypothetical protein